MTTEMIDHRKVRSQALRDELLKESKKKTPNYKAAAKRAIKEHNLPARFVWTVFDCMVYVTGDLPVEAAYPDAKEWKAIEAAINEARS